MNIVWFPAAVALLAFTVLLPRPVHGQESDPLDSLLAENRFAIAREAGTLTGTGAEFLVREGRAADFFLIGEDHGTAEIPVFTRLLYNDLSRVGYRRLAIEVSPRMARALEAVGRSGERSIIRYVHEGLMDPAEVPFYSSREEAALLERVVRGALGASALWGLDQEFIFSSPSTLRWLEENAPSDAARALSRAYRTRAEAGLAAMRRGDGTDLFLFTADSADYARLRAAFRGRRRALEVIDGMQASARIYRMHRTGRAYRSNAVRERLLKRNFTDHFLRAEAEGDPGRVVVKMGAAHLTRGRKLGGHVLSLGNFLSEFAVSRASGSFHLMVAAGPGSESARPGPDLGLRTAPIGEREWLQPLRPHLADGEWTVFDLRPLRPALAAGTLEVDPYLENVIWGYDALAVLPGTTAATYD